MELHKVAVDALNVFPVPDGDTGTNMNLTLQAVVKALEKVPPAGTVSQVAQQVASGSLMGARGNSGVILSQLFRGFARCLDRKDNITVKDFAAALAAGVDTAYKAVGRPVEGTILTVAKEAAKMAQNRARSEEDFCSVMKAIINQAESTLAKTPEMLPVLKRAGVVDAGGQGLIYIYHGFLMVLEGKDVPKPMVVSDIPIPLPYPSRQSPLVSEESFEFLYCTEFLVMNPHVDEFFLRGALESQGDSLLVVGDEDIIKVHVHTNHPGVVLELAMEHGELSGIKIENMKEQHQHTHWAEAFEDQPTPGEGKEIGVVAVVAGSGLANVFKSLGADIVVEGGQTMNPSTEDLAAAVNSLACDAVVILPNNKNIIMAAEQVQEISSKTVRVLPSHTVPQGLAALLSYEADVKDFDRVANAMKRRISSVKSGQVTYAVKSYNSEVGEIHEGDILGLHDGRITSVGKEVEAVSLDLLHSMVDDNDGVVSLFYGEDVSEESARMLADKIEAAFPHCQLDFCQGGQPFYYYIFSVE